MPTFFPALVYILCFATSGLCALLLTRSYRRSAARLLLWSAVAFWLLAANHLAVFLDLVVLPGPDVDLRWVRSALSLAAVSVLIFGFVWDRED